VDKEMISERLKTGFTTEVPAGSGGRMIAGQYVSVLSVKSKF
jgi:hypothetical protein